MAGKKKCVITRTKSNLNYFNCIYWRIVFILSTKSSIFHRKQYIITKHTPQIYRIQDFPDHLDHICRGRLICALRNANGRNTDWKLRLNLRTCRCGRKWFSFSHFLWFMKTIIHSWPSETQVLNRVGRNVWYVLGPFYLLPF